jgi:hypothetical protein
MPLGVAARKKTPDAFTVESWTTRVVLDVIKVFQKVTLPHGSEALLAERQKALLKRPEPADASRRRVARSARRFILQ